MKIHLFGVAVLLWTLDQSLCSDLATAEAPLAAVSPNGEHVEEKGKGPWRNEVPEEELIEEMMDDELTGNCYERVEKPLRVHLRGDWETDEGPINTKRPVQLMVVRDGGKHCTTRKLCGALVRSMRRRVQRKECDLRENFYVGGDGNVYEGRGWRVAPFWHLNGLGEMAVTVQFLGKHEDRPPGPEAMKAYETWVEASIRLGEISKDHKVMSMRQLLNDSTLLGGELHETVTRWRRYIEDRHVSHFWEYVIPEHLKMVSRKDWNGSAPSQTLSTFSGKVVNIMISESGDECKSQAECVERMQKDQTEHRNRYGDLLHSFYIADNGEVFEGRGWDFLPHWRIPAINDDYVSIQFIGNFTHEIPSQQAINSFKLLVQGGVWLEKISPSYKITSTHGLYLEDEQNVLGEALRKYAEGWVKWSKGYVSTEGMDLGISKPLAFIERKNWGPNPSDSSVRNVQTPVSIVMVFEVGDRCFTHHECIKLIKEQPSDFLVQYDSVIHNYYIGEDGHIYEGRGLRLSHWTSTFLNNSMVTIKFLGTFEARRPSKLAVRAFQGLLKYAIDYKVLSTNYKLVSFNVTDRLSPRTDTGLDSYLSTLKSWDTNLTIEIDKEIIPGATEIKYPVLSLDASYIRNKVSGNLSHPVGYIVIGDVRVNQMTPCHYEHSDHGCYYALQDIQSSLENSVENFNVVDQGWAIEGLGWNYASPWNNKGMNMNFIFVRFVLKSQNSLPSPQAMYAFRRLVEIGVKSGKLASDFKIVSFRQIFNDSESPPDKLSDNVKTWDRWSSHLPLPFMENDQSELSLYVPRGSWNSRTVIGSIYTRHSEHYVVVMSVGNRCFSADECISAVQKEENRTLKRFGSIPENFYVGEDGRVYEGRGWKMAPTWSWLSGCYTVAFLGRFQSETPSPMAVAAIEFLMTFGIQKGWIRSDYILTSMRNYCENGEWIGDSLHQLMAGRKNWKAYPYGNSCPKGYLTHPIVEQEELKFPSSSIWRSASLSHPLEFVFVREGGKRCFEYGECVSILKTLTANGSQLTENFYVGDDGYPYEGIGWDWRSPWDFERSGSSLTVQFLGSFESEAPSPSAMSGLFQLLRLAVHHGKLSQDYRILLFPENLNPQIRVGAKLKDAIVNVERWFEIV